MTAIFLTNLGYTENITTAFPRNRILDENALVGSAGTRVMQDKQFLLEGKLLGGNSSKTASFGYDVDVSGDTAVVGAWYDDIGANKAQGSVFVFVKKAGFWVEQAKLTAADGVSKLHFGQRVAIDGDTIVVGAPMSTSLKERYKGAVYVFKRTDGHWGEQIKLEPSRPTFVETFGTAVDISGDTIIVGSMGHDNAPDDKIAQAHGAAYIFTRSSGNWSERQKLTSDGLTNTAFGSSVAIHDNMAVVGTMSDTNAIGAAYIFAFDGTSWKRDGKVQSGVRRSNEHFGWQSVAIDRGTVVVGASGSGSRLPGAVYVFNKGTAGWTQTTKLTAADNDRENAFGQSVDISGDTIVVGMMEMRGPIAPRAYVFGRKLTPKGQVWTQNQMLISPETFIGDSFAQGVGISGNNIIVGATNHDSDPKRNTQGAAYIFNSSGSSSASTGGRSGNSDPLRTTAPPRPVNLVRNGRKNGYTTTQNGNITNFEANDVEDPLSKKLLEGLNRLRYRCQAGQDPIEVDLTFARGRSNRRAVSCMIMVEPQILLLGEPAPNDD